MSDTTITQTLQTLQTLQAFELMQQQPQSAMEVTNLDRLHVAICGEPKTGKSFIIAKTARKPLLVYDGDDRRESIAGIEGVFIKTLTDINDTTPTAWSAFEVDLSTLEYAKTQGKLDLKSIALDSATFWRKYAEHQFLKDASGSSRAKYKIGSTDYLIAKDWDAVTGVQKMLESAINRMFALGLDVYVTFHTRPEKDQQRSTKTDFVYKDSLTVDPPNLKMLLPKFNDCWRTFTENGGYKVQLKPDYIFNAATVLKNVDATEDADIQKLLAKHNGK